MFEEKRQVRWYWAGPQWRMMSGITVLWLGAQITDIWGKMSDVSLTSHPAEHPPLHQISLILQLCDITLHWTTTATTQTNITNTSRPSQTSTLLAWFLLST